MMKLKLYPFVSLFFFSLLTISCNFLNIVPDEDATEDDMSADRNAAQNFLYSCYGYLPQPNYASESLDFMTGDEVVTAFEHETFASFPKGNYSASNPVISYWNTLYQGIRQCYVFLDDLKDANKFPGLTEADRKDYEAQTTFLVGYYHFLLSRCYGPIIVIKSTPDATVEPDAYLGRTPYDSCVSFICNKFDEAAKNLPSTRSGNRSGEFGLATSVAAKAMKAKMLLYAASPLFNGNSGFYSSFKDKNGAALMPLTYDSKKWIKARDAYKEAIDAAEAAGYHLYDRENAQSSVNGYPDDPVVRKLRYTISDYTETDADVGGNSEVIWADSRDEGLYGLQNKTIPYTSSNAWNGISPTLAMLKRFYTKNGLPIDEDPSFDANTMFQSVTIDKSHAEEGAPGKVTFKFNLDREPRYYAWVAFQGGYFEILSASNNGAYNNDTLYTNYSDYKHGRMVCDFVLGGNCSRGSVTQPRSNNYAPTGFLNKKGVDPDLSKTETNDCHKHYPWPIIRLAELYLGYAEACIETGDLSTARTYINKVRTRAGIPTLETSWSKSKDPNKPYTQSGLRDIVRQERMIEFYLENQNFWDMRRWLLAEKYFNTKAQGMNISATSVSDFCKVTEVSFERKFTSPANYLMPIPIDDMNKDSKLVQNPGY